MQYRVVCLPHPPVRAQDYSSLCEAPYKTARAAPKEDAAQVPSNYDIGL